MENFDLTKILKDCPKGTKLYSPMVGEVTLNEIIQGATYEIEVRDIEHDVYSFTKDGKYFDSEDAECVLFPSKENRDWSKVQAEYQEISKALNNVVVEEIKKNIFEPFQRVLVRNDYRSVWIAGYYSHYQEDDDFPFFCVGSKFKQCIPYEGNEDLLGIVGVPND